MTDEPLNTSIRADLLASVEELARLRRVAAGHEPADLIVAGGTVLAVHTGELLERDMVIAGRHIAAVTPPGRIRAAHRRRRPLRRPNLHRRPLPHRVLHAVPRGAGPPGGPQGHHHRSR